VNGQLKWGAPAPSVGSSPEFAGKRVKLRSKEGDVFELPAEAACLSLRVRSLVMEKGCEDELPFPLKKSVLAKVVEYLKHHKEHSTGEIRTPLESDNLQECGATRWDSSFVNVDKELLFELCVAASCFDIPSLFFLTSAKAAIITKDKSADKLRKEFSMTNDLPASEEAELRRQYVASRRLSGSTGDNDLSQLAASSVIMQSMAAAAEKNGVPEFGNLSEGDGSSSAVSTKSWRHAIWRAAVVDDWQLLAGAPAEVKADRQLMLSVLMTSQGAAFKYVSSELRSDEKVILEAVKHSAGALAEAAPTLLNDRAFLLKAITANSASLGYASEQWRNDKDLLREAARTGKGSALQGASAALRSDRDFILELVLEDAEAYKYASEDLRSQQDFALAVAKRNGETLRFMIPKFRADRSIVDAAVARNPQVANYAHSSRRSEMGVMEGGVHGEEQMKLEHKLQLKAAQAENRTVELVAGGPRQTGVPLSQQGQKPCVLKLQKTVQFSAMSTMAANMGQANYIAANSYLDKIPNFQRPEIDAVALMWGAVGNIGMRFKAFASADVLNATPEMLLSISDASKVLCVTCTRMDPPEWYSAAHFDEMTRQYFLQPQAGVIKQEGKVEAAFSAPAEVHSSWADDNLTRDRAALKDRTDVDRRPVPENHNAQSSFQSPLGAPSSLGPLGGWPSLVRGSADSTVHLAEGTRVRLAGLRAKNGLTGVLVQQFGDGKWKVKLDDGSGNALLRSGFFEAISAPDESSRSAARRQENPAEAEARSAAAAELRRAKIAERRSALKDRITSRQQARPLTEDGSSRQQQFFIAGSWDSCELHEMSLSHDRTFVFQIRIGALGQESFQVLLDRSWNACLHAGEILDGSAQTGYAVKGPDPKWRCEGMDFVISGEVSSTYEVKLYLNPRGNASKVQWTKVSSAGHPGSLYYSCC
ncbi:unnamed protein product, partial [Polarella glacialis]